MSCHVISCVVYVSYYAILYYVMLYWVAISYILSTMHICIYIYTRSIVLCYIYMYKFTPPPPPWPPVPHFCADPRPANTSLRPPWSSQVLPHVPGLLWTCITTLGLGFRGLGFNDSKTLWGVLKIVVWSHRDGSKTIGLVDLGCFPAPSGLQNQAV